MSTKPDVLSFRALIDEMKAVAQGEASAPARPSKRLYASERARAQVVRRERSATRPGGPPSLPKPTPETAPLPGLATIGAMTRLFTPANQRLVELIASGTVQSVAELAKRTHRAESNVSRTLAKLVALGVVSMEPGQGRAKVPRLLVQSLDCRLDLSTGRVQVLEIARSGESAASRAGTSRKSIATETA